MNRLSPQLVAMVLLAGFAIACAPKTLPEAAPPEARPVPNLEGLASWLGGDSGPDGSVPEFFIQMADPQLGFSGSPLWLALIGKTWNDDDFAVDAAKFETAIAHANELGPAFVVICGDLVHRVGYRGQIDEFKRIAAGLDSEIPLHLVAGNHDVGNRPTLESLLAYREEFGPDWYSFRHGEVYGIVLNSQLIDEPDGVPGEAQRQFEWLREELIRAKASEAEHILIFQHQAFFLVSPDEAKKYYNVTLEERTRYLELLAEAEVKTVFAGHYHRNAVGRSGSLEMVTTGPVGRPLGNDPSGFRIVKVAKDALEHEYFSLVVR